LLAAIAQRPGTGVPQQIEQLPKEWQEAVAQREIAGVVRWLIENRDALLQMTARTVDVRPIEELPGHLEITGSKMGLDALLGPEDADKQKK